mgnify:CR=1 FL=1
MFTKVKTKVELKESALEKQKKSIKEVEKKMIEVGGEGVIVFTITS